MWSRMLFCITYSSILWFQFQKSTTHPAVILHSMVALEKFAQTSMSFTFYFWNDSSPFLSLQFVSKSHKHTVNKIILIIQFKFNSKIKSHFYCCFVYFQGENKTVILAALLKCPDHPMSLLEDWYQKDDNSGDFGFSRREVGFCSGWCLDNLCKWKIYCLRNKYILFHC